MNDKVDKKLDSENEIEPKEFVKIFTKEFVIGLERPSVYASCQSSH